MKPRISMVTLGVKDMVIAVNFYEKGLALPRFPFQGNAAFFQLSGSWLALYPWKLLAQDATINASGSGFRGTTLAHVVSTKDEVRDLLDQAAKSGGTIVKQAQDVFWGGCSGYFADPDGHLWEVAWNPQFWPGPRDDE